ncbi:hypothetical protein YC2023_031584 [Brassica napus]
MGLEILEESGSNRVTKMVRFGSGLRKKPLGRDFGEMVRVERWGRNRCSMTGEAIVVAKISQLCEEEDELLKKKVNLRVLKWM